MFSFYVSSADSNSNLQDFGISTLSNGTVSPALEVFSKKELTVPESTPITWDQSRNITKKMVFLIVTCFPSPLHYHYTVRLRTISEVYATYKILNELHKLLVEWGYMSFDSQRPDYSLIANWWDYDKTAVLKQTFLLFLQGLFYMITYLCPQ